jgi:tetratricopeptide (TPR) repeat protein
MRYHFQLSAIVVCVLTLGRSGVIAGDAQPSQPGGESTVEFVLDANREYSRLMSQMAEQFRQRQFDLALKSLDAADRIKKNVPDALNARGAILAEKHEFDEAEDYYKRALAIEPSSFWPQFNLGEILFMQKKYADAREHWKKVQAAFPDNDLPRFKIMLAYLMEKNFDDAQIMLDNLNFLGETPVYYYAQASWEFARNNPAGGRRWIDLTETKFGRGKHEFLYNTLVDVGWVEHGKYSR